MPRYFFDTTDGDRDTDQEGVELSGQDEAIVQVIRYAGALLNDQPSLLMNKGELIVSMRAEAGGEIARVQVELFRP